MANSNAGGELYVAAAAQPDELDQSGYEALTWVKVNGVGSIGEIGTTTNVLTYDTWDTEVTDKAKGISNAGDPEIELSRLPTDAGQILLRTQADTSMKYAFKIVRNDAPQAGWSKTTIYNRGLVTGPRRPQGRNEDFDLEIFTLALVQKEIIVDPAAP